MSETMSEASSGSVAWGQSVPLKTNGVNDVMLDRWRDYPHLRTDTLWLQERSGRGAEHAKVTDWPGMFIPEVAAQLIERYTKQDDLVLDLFFGSGTTADECRRLRRRCVGVDLSTAAIARYLVRVAEHPGIQPLVADAADPMLVDLLRTCPPVNFLMAEAAQLTILHPPYGPIIQYDRENPRDLSTVDLTGFYAKWAQVCENAWALTKPEGYVGLVIGDLARKSKQLGRNVTEPMGFKCMEALQRQGFELVGINIKDIHGNEVKGKNGNLWRFRALRGGFFVFAHEYIFVMQRPPEKAGRRK